LAGRSPPTVPTPNRPKPIGGPAEPAEAHASTACVQLGVAVLHLEPHPALGVGVAPYPPPLTRDDWSDWAGGWAAPRAWVGAALFRPASHAPVSREQLGPGTICAGGLAGGLEERPAVLLLRLLLSALRLVEGNGVVVCDPPV
jgi:hypothetical protein